MIQETIVTTINAAGVPHIAPMGIHIEGDIFIILPFKPAVTLDNVLQTGVATINYCDDVRVFAGCLTGRRNWPLKSTDKIKGHYLADTLAHAELVLDRVEDDEVRPKLFCKAVHKVNHKAIQGFNRAQFSVLEAAILLSRLNRLPLNKVESELGYLRIGLEKCAGEREWEAWEWLMQAIKQFKVGTKTS